ncbi:MAG: glycosyltransferase family 4 protein, partial [Bacteroidales bacterium]
SEVRDLLAKARCSVIPSEWNENNPLSVIESLCMGTPVLGANIGGIPELINKENGLLFKPSDSDDLKNKIIELFTDKKYDRNTIAYKALSSYNAGTYYREIIKIYNSN